MPETSSFQDRLLLEPPLSEAVVCERRYLEDSSGGFNCTVVFTNVPHHCVWHSPTGFEFGYGGSGPADLALNILEEILLENGYVGRRERHSKGSSFALASLLHQEFKRDFLAGLPEEGGRIERSAIDQWIEEKSQALREEARWRLEMEYMLDDPRFLEGEEPMLFTFSEIQGLAQDLKLHIQLEVRPDGVYDHEGTRVARVPAQEELPR